MQDVEATFARRLREAREAAGLSQVRLADLLGRQEGINLDPTAITRMERGDRRIALGEAYGLARVLRVPLEYLCSPSSSDRVRELEDELRKTREAISNAEAQAAQASHQLTDLRNRAGLLSAALQAADDTAQLQPVDRTEFQRLADEAWGRRLAGENLEDIARMLAAQVAPSAFDSLSTVFDILRGTVPVAALRAAVALQARAADPSPPISFEELDQITLGLAPDVAGQVIAAVLEVATARGSILVLRDLRAAVLEKQAAEELAAYRPRREDGTEDLPTTQGGDNP